MDAKNNLLAFTEEGQINAPLGSNTLDSLEPLNLQWGSTLATSGSVFQMLSTCATTRIGCQEPLLWLSPKTVSLPDCHDW